MAQVNLLHGIPTLTLCYYKACTYTSYEPKYCMKGPLINLREPL